MRQTPIRRPVLACRDAPINIVLHAAAARSRRVASFTRIRTPPTCAERPSFSMTTIASASRAAARSARVARLVIAFQDPRTAFGVR